jgi:hypothetical protein
MQGPAHECATRVRPAAASGLDNRSRGGNEHSRRYIDWQEKSDVRQNMPVAQQAPLQQAPCRLGVSQ